jgi:branched-chain amino acid aminotransferase
VRIPDRSSRVWIDGTSVSADQATVSIDDPGLQAGLGLFETLALRRGRVLDLLPHLERMQTGAVLLGIELPPRQRLLDTVEQAAAQVSGTAFAWLKIMALRSGRWLVFTGSMSAGEEGREVSAIVLPWRRDSRDPLVTVKSTCYAGHQLGLELARRRGADEGLWLNSRGHLAEGCTSNLFVVRHRRLFTPALHEGILPGVVRSLAIEASRELGIPVHETRVRLKRLRAADEAFLTSSLSAVRPLVRVDGRAVGRGVPGPVTRRIASRCQSMRQRDSDGGKLSDTT